MTSNEFRQSSTVFGHRLYPQALLLRHSPLEPTLASAYPPKPHFLRWVPGVTGNHYGQSSTVFRHRLHPRALLLSHSPLEQTLASAYPPKPLLFEIFEVGARRDLQSLRANFHRIWVWLTPTSPTPEAQPPEANFSIRVSSQTPSFYTFRGRGL